MKPCGPEPPDHGPGSQEFSVEIPCADTKHSLLPGKHRVQLNPRMNSLMKRNTSSLLLVALFIAVPVCASTAATAPSPLFQEIFHFPLGDYWCEPNRLSAVDVDGDGRKDIVVMATTLVTNNSVRIYNCRAILLRAQPDGGFTDSVIADFPGDYGYNIATGDLNNDGSPDIVLRASLATHVFQNDGQGNFRRVGGAPSGYYIGQLVDVNRDGYLDILSGMQSAAGGSVLVSTNRGTGTNFSSAWQSRYFGSDNDSIETVLSVNLNGDNLPDIAAREIYGGRLITFMGTSNAVPFVELRETSLGDRTFALAAGRVNGDSLDDLAVYVGWGEARVLVNQGGGVMSNTWTSPNLGGGAFNLALADFDGDGLDDLFVGTFGRSRSQPGTLHIYRNRLGNGFEEWWQSQLPGNGYTGSVADMNGDGAPDLIVGEKNSLRILLNQTGWPQITRLVRATNGMEINWTAVPGKAYRVQFKNRLVEPEWTDLSGDVTAPTASATKIDETGGAFAVRFYRVFVLP